MSKRSRSTIWCGVKAPTCVAFAATLAFVLPAAALGALPTPSSNLIVPGVSVGGVTLGSSLAEGTAAWGKGGVCGAGDVRDPAIECTYTTKGELTGEAAFGLEEGTVVTDAFIDAWPSKSKLRAPDFSTPLARLKTANGIHLDSTLKQLEAAYPHIKKSAVRGLTLYLILAPDGAVTHFDFYKGRVVGIEVVAAGIQTTR
jgi:hypothetical protein